LPVETEPKAARFIHHMHAVAPPRSAGAGPLVTHANWR